MTPSLQRSLFFSTVLVAGMGTLASAQQVWTHGLDMRNVGPSVMSGRVTDVAVVADTMYVAYATGGLWRSINHGTTFEPLLDATCKLGAVAAHPSGRIVAGSGEVNSSRSSYAGNGVHVSDDFGQTWRHAGLPEARHIGRVAIHPQTPDILYVAALGELYTTNRGGGVYKSTDGGKSWVRVLHVPAPELGKDAVVGAVDLVLDTSSPDHLVAATWDRTRRGHDFTEGGTGSGIWETFDGGATWARISQRPGFPEGPEAGRIGLALHPTSGTLYALIDNQAPRPEAADDDETAGTVAPKPLAKEDFLDMDAEAFRALADTALQAFLAENDFDPADSAAAVKARVREGDLQPRALYDYLTDGNAALFDTEIVGPELYRIDLRAGDAGTWSRTHEDWLDDVWYTYGYYFATVSVDPTDPQSVYIAGVPLLHSSDGGATFASLGAPNVHVDHHKVWINPRNPNHLINGNDGGINVSWDGGASWIKCNSPAVGQFYAVEVDEAEPYRIYGGLQDNGTWVGPSTHTETVGWHQSGHHGFTSLGGGDGMQIEVDTRTNDVVYTGYQFGWYTRTNRATGERLSLHPKHALGETPLRWNWQTPIVLSNHHQDVVYMGSNKVHRSLNGGETWEALSGDLTRGGRTGNVPFGTLTSLAEHPAHFGQLAAGSDDGRLHVTLDGGHSWKELALPVPTVWGKGENRRTLWVTEVMWSVHDDDLLVVALNSYRNDDPRALVFATRNLGKTWDAWGDALPEAPVNALVESADRAGWWVVGTDDGAHFTVDEGQTFTPLDLPPVPVHDLVIQERENELVLGTHGRSIFVLDLDPLLTKEGTPEAWAASGLNFERDTWTVTHRDDWGERGWAWSEPEDPAVDVWVWSPRAGTAALAVTLPSDATPSTEGASDVLASLRANRAATEDHGTVELVEGLQRVAVPLRLGDGFADVGTHTVTLSLLAGNGHPAASTTCALVVEPGE